MCGIAGVYGETSDPLHRRAIVERMIAALRHRGPDASGIYTDSETALGHARLSIIDLAAGQQPMTNEDASLWVTFNGEIFNYIELYSLLEARGHQFRTHSDTEVILHQYEESGTDCVDAFNGDFAFALWDKRKRQLLLARDRMGVRPVYYTFQQGALVFASEIKALLAYPGVAAEIDPVALDQCFTFWFPLAPRTPFKGIYELPPGHLLIARGNDITVKPYWSLRYPRKDDYRPLTLREEAARTEELHALLLDATRIRLRSDVPVGAYLSGGLDSSVITALTRKVASDRLCTFSVSFETAEFDESSYQQAVVRGLGTEHKSVLCRKQNIAAHFPAVIRHTERPVLRTAPAPLFQLSEFVRDNGFKVVLTGEGADEVLAGYDIFKEDKIRRFWARYPASTARPQLLRRLYPYLSGLQSQPQVYLEAFFRDGLDRPGDAFFSHLPRWNMTARTKVFFSDDMRSALAGYDALEDLRERLPREYCQWHPLSRAQYLEAAYLLPGYILSAQGDRVTMAHSVEGRFPFLDHRVVEFCAQLHPEEKLKGLTEKAILRNAMRSELPDAVLNRPKQPYRSPDSQSFFQETSPDYVDDILSSESLRASGYFDPAAVGKLVQKCRRLATPGFRDNMALVGILSTELLDRLFVRGLPNECSK